MRRWTRTTAIVFLVVIGTTAMLHAQELLLRGAAESNDPHSSPATQSDPGHQAHQAPDYDFTHPTVSSDGAWGGLLTALILVFFAMAVLIGALTDIDRGFDPPVADAHDPHDAHGDSGAHAHGHAASHH